MVGMRTSQALIIFSIRLGGRRSCRYEFASYKLQYFIRIIFEQYLTTVAYLPCNEYPRGYYNADDVTFYSLLPCALHELQH